MLAFEVNNPLIENGEGAERRSWSCFSTNSEFRELSKEMGKGIESICITSLDLKFDEIFKRIHKSWVIKFAWSSLD